MNYVYSLCFASQASAVFISNISFFFRINLYQKEKPPLKLCISRVPHSLLSLFPPPYMYYNSY
jgi:hypothetical protein